MDLRQAVDLAMEGKEEGYNYLYQQTCQKSYYVALKYMKQEDAALDVLQDAYIKAFQNLEQLQDAEKFPAWFSKVVANKALDELKKKKVVLFSQIETADSTVESLFEDDRIDTQPELSLDQKETSRLVQEMINVLSDEQRICILMYYVEEIAVKDIAETLGVSENTVKSRLNYGRKNIKDKVLELEKKGTKLYGLAPVPFFLYLLLSDTMNAQAAELPANSILETATKEVLKGTQGAGAGTIAQTGGKAMGLMTKKVIIGIIAAVVISGGTIGGVLAYQNYQENLAEEAMAVQQEEARKEAEEAERLEEEKHKEEASKENTEKSTEQPTDEVATQPEESTEQSEEATPEPAEEVPPQQQFTFTDLEQVMYAKSSVNVRDLPSADGTKLGGLSTNQEVAVNGQCNETGWYRISYNGGEAFVSDSHLVSEKPVEEVAQQPQEQPAQSGEYWLTGYWVNCCTDQGDDGPLAPNGNCPYALYTVIEETENSYSYYAVHNHGAWKDGSFINLEIPEASSAMKNYNMQKWGNSFSCTYSTYSIGAYNEGCIHYTTVTLE